MHRFRVNFLGFSVSGVLWLFCLWPLMAQALPIPLSVREFLISKGRTDLIARFESIPTLTPEEFSAEFSNDSQRPLGAGYNGLVFVDSHNRVTKFSNAVMAAIGKVTLDTRPGVLRFTPAEIAAIAPRWLSLNTNTAIRDVNIPELRGVAADEPLGSQPLGEELLGSLIWAAYNPRFTTFPETVSSDGLAFRTRLIDGVPLAKILKSQREGTDLHRQYDIRKLWRQVVYWQQIARMMLRDCGLTLDLFQPSNMIVTGTFDNPQIEVIDHAMARPSAEAQAFYQQRDWVIPEPTVSDALKIIVWPTMSQHIVVSLLWNLNFHQAVDFVKAYYDITDTYDAVRRVASFEQWSIVEAPFLGNYRNIHIARVLLKRRGARRAIIRAERHGIALESLVSEASVKFSQQFNCKNALTQPD